MKRRKNVQKLIKIKLQGKLHVWLEKYNIPATENYGILNIHELINESSNYKGKTKDNIRNFRH